MKAVAELYEHDRYAWTLQNAALIRQGRLAEVDLEHVAEELAGLRATAAARAGGSSGKAWSFPTTWSEAALNVEFVLRPLSLGEGSEPLCGLAPGPLRKSHEITEYGFEYTSRTHPKTTRPFDAHGRLSGLLIRDLRNAINHEYEENPDRLSEFFSLLIQETPTLNDYHQRMVAFCQASYKAQIGVGDPETDPASP